MHKIVEYLIPNESKSEKDFFYPFAHARQYDKAELDDFKGIHVNGPYPLYS